MLEWICQMLTIIKGRGVFMTFKRSMKVIASLMLLAIILVTALSLSGCGERVVDVKSAYFLDLSFSGLNGGATADIEVDTHNIKAELVKYKDDKNIAEIANLFYGISFEMEDPTLNGKLKNDDKFNVVASYNEELAKELNFAFSNTVISCTVSGLKDGVEVDAFKNLKVTFKGKNGSGYVETDTSKCESAVRNYVTFSVESDNNYSLSNGDKVTVTAIAYTSLEDNGYFLKKTTKEYTVSGLVGPVESLDGVDTTQLRNSMQSELNSKLKSGYTVMDWNYQFESGKKRDLSTFYLNYTTESELVNYEYIHDASNASENALIAYYKVKVVFKAKRDQSYVDDGCEAFKKDTTDTGITYVAIKSSALEVTSDKKINKDNYTYFDDMNGIDIATIREEANIEGLYASEFFDSDFKKTKGLKEDEKPTEAPTEKATEKASEKATEAVTKSDDKDSTEPSTLAVATEVVTEKTTEKTTEDTTKS